MRRESKYRGRHINTGEWVYGYLIGNDVIVGDIVEFNNEYFNTEYWCRVDPETVGQYIGLKDKNEREIYAGDIVRYLDGSDCSTECGTDFDEYLNHGVIEWYPEEARYLVSNRNMVDLETFFEEIGDSEVIGTIYENPELIEV